MLDSANGSLDVWDIRLLTQPISTSYHSIARDSKVSIAATGMHAVSLYAQ